MSQIISRQKKSETELRVIAGASPYMATLFSTLTTGKMKQYHRVADHFPHQQSSESSGFSTPQQTTGQRQSYNDRLSALSAVAPARKLQFLSKDIAKEVNGRAQSYQSRFLPPA